MCEKAPRAQVRALAPRLWPPVAALLDGGGPAQGVLTRWLPANKDVFEGFKP